ncbi:16S rRNA (guanine(527)-N(7))-methyltransferase RsmG [Helicobacter suis]|uniref:16S rRNA (guanine(527)-N(7))-methyltransferase RsmG n=1 Tax=Helicobacter suis TaxID=104628 RepID=UPI0013D0573D|nr:16S rRNA (guanine(527)-N(7))-methyltransferase RsmG [Helicobacter suis]
MKPILKRFATLLLEWNCIHNLSGAKSLEDIEVHINDSIQVLDFIKPFDTCLDIGSGAGFPALPLSVYCPHARFILVEPNIKKSAFLHHVKNTLALDNLQIKRTRIQTLNPLEIERVDLITSRALMPTQDLLALGMPFLKSGGYFLFYKGSQLANEITYNPHECFVYGKRVYFYHKGKPC